MNASSNPSPPLPGDDGGEGRRAAAAAPPFGPASAFDDAHVVERAAAEHEAAPAGQPAADPPQAAVHAGAAPAHVGAAPQTAQEADPQLQRHDANHTVGGSPLPEAASDGDPRHPRRAQRPLRRRSPPHLPTREQARATLVGLAPAVLLGEISREDAHAARSILDTYLRHSGDDQRSKQSHAPIDIDELRALGRDVPRVVNLVAPLLSDEELEELFGSSADDDRDRPGPADADDGRGQLGTGDNPQSAP